MSMALNRDSERIPLCLRPATAVMGRMVMEKFKLS